MTPGGAVLTGRTEHPAKLLDQLGASELIHVRAGGERVRRGSIAAHNGSRLGSLDHPEMTRGL
jgi:hypothetical protein